MSLIITSYNNKNNYSDINIGTVNYSLHFQTNIFIEIDSSTRITYAFNPYCCYLSDQRYDKIGLRLMHILVSYCCSANYVYYEDSSLFND